MRNRLRFLANPLRCDPQFTINAPYLTSFRLFIFVLIRLNYTAR